MGACASSSGGSLYGEGEFDLENPEVSERERELYDEIEPLLAETKGILQQLESYEGCAEFIKLAVTTPNTENDVAAWNAVVPAVNMLKEFFDYYARFRDGMFKILAFVTNEDPSISMPLNLALSKQLVAMFDFVIRFDELKMSKASIQNDFSFYRRSMSRMKRGNVDLNVQEPPVNDEVANRMSLFMAYPNPMGKALIDEFAKTAGGDISAEYLQRVFAVVARACLSVIVLKQDKGLLYHRAIVAAMMFYDFTHPQGVFVNRSEIDAAACLTCLKNLDSVTLLNTIRYGSRTFNSDSTPRKVREIMGE